MSQSFLNQVKEGAINGWHKYKVLPSITAAQACLESGWGGSDLAKSPNFNLFGIKDSPDWNGPTVNYRTQEWSASKGYYYVYADFRVYSSWSHSVEEHGAFFTNTEWRKNNYRKVVGETDYKTAAQELKNAGYATDPGYPQKLINIIKQYNLQEWDREAFSGGNGGSSVGTSISTRTSEPRLVGGSITTQASNDTSKRSITVIGDSLGVGTEPYLKNYTWKSANYNNYGSRQWTHSQSIYDGLVQLQAFIDAGTLNDYVVMILGTNRGVNSSEIQRAVNMIGSNRKLLLVDTDSQVGHKDSVASAYMLASETYANVFYVNWSHHAQASYYGSDNIHMTSAGYKAHAEFIVQAVYEVANTNWSNEPTKIVTESNKIVSDIKSVDYQDDIFVSPNGESIIYNKTLNEQFGFRPKGGQVLWIERILKVNTDNEQEMLEEGLKYMREHSQPATQYTVSLKELPDTVSIGDVGIFVDHEFNPPLAIEARVLDITTSESNPNNNTVTIGNVKELYPQSKDDIIAIQKQLQDTREDLLDEFYEGEPLDIVIEGTSGLILSGERSQFRTELIIGPTTNLELTGQGSHTIELYGAKKTDNEFRFSGKLTNTLIFEEVDEAFKYIVENTESDAVIDDPSQNPQGIDIPNPLQPVDMKTLDIQDFKVEFLDALGQVVLTDTIPIYDDGQFNYPIVGFEKNIRQIRIIHDKDMDFATISFTEREANRATIDSTQLIARIYQGNREVTERFNNFSWVRVSNQFREDEGWNDKNKFVQSNHITVYADDIEDNESTFVVRLFDDDFERIVASSSAVVKVNVEGKSAYQLAVEAGFEGTLDEWVASLRGSDGVNGIPGEPGEDGQSTYIHVAWADSPMGDGFSTSDSTDKEYMGTYVDEIEEDSENYLDYQWMKVKGEKGEPGEQGPRGLQGLQGPEGKQGIEGKKGADGKSSYTHIAYATGDQGQSFSHDTFSQATHIGMYVSDNQNSSGNWRDYKWTLIKGKDGARGLEGPKGKDGLTPYFHTAWANSADGKSGFSTTVSAGKLYLGTVTTFEPDDPTDYKAYSWTLIKGEKGEKGDKGEQGPRGVEGAQGPQGDQGIRGPKGDNGLSSYTHIAYADTITGSGFSHNDASKPFIGIYTDNDPTSSGTASKYTWSKWHGEDGSDGVQGPKGADGLPSYTHFAYANNATGTSGFSTTDSLNKSYLGIYTDNTKADSEDPSKYTWTLIKGATGAQGPQGVRGLQGPEGKQGIKGDPGTDGKSSYTHIAYATGDQGQSFNHNTFEQATHVGMYVSDNQNSSGNWRDYEWTLIRGRDGSQGIRGPQGPEGKTPYFHIAYANNSTGTSGFSINDSANKLYIGTYTDFTSTDSTDPSKYKWTLVKGAKGDTGPRGPQGIEGPKGTDGTTTYTWIRYADTPTSGMDNSPVGKKYIGLSFNQTTQTESNNYNDYQWSLMPQNIEIGGRNLFRNSDFSEGGRYWTGQNGGGTFKDSSVIISNGSSIYQGVDVEEGEQATASIKAKGVGKVRARLGQSSSPYQQVSSVFKTYVFNIPRDGDGNRNLIIEADENSEIIVERVKLEKGNTATDWTPAPEDTQSEIDNTKEQVKKTVKTITEEYYQSTSATSQTGGRWTTTAPTWNANKFMFVRSKITYVDGTTDYTPEINLSGAKGDKGERGPQGPQGIRGPAGTNGQSQYVHIRYSVNSNGSGMTTNPSSTTKYVGIAVTNSATAPAYTVFTWSKYVGEDGSTGARGPQGVPGKNGANGTTTYTWVKYANDKNGGGMSNYPEGKKYIGLAFNKTTPTESTTPSHYQWSLMPQNIEIGGRNLLTNSTFKDGQRGWSIQNGTVKYIDGLMVSSGSPAEVYQTNVLNGLDIATASVWVKGNGRFQARAGGGTRIGYTAFNHSTFKQVSVAFNDMGNGNFILMLDGDNLEVEKVKLEKGNTSTDWTPAPEDVQSEIDDKASAGDLDETVRTIETESEKIASLRTDVDITKNNMLITHTDEYVNKITTTESKANDLESRVVQVEETKENVDTFFQFDDAFTIGKSNAQTKLRMTNDEIQFLDGETKGTYITGNTMVSQNIQIQDKLNLPKHTMETEGDVTVIRFTG